MIFSLIFTAFTIIAVGFIVRFLYLLSTRHEVNPRQKFRSVKTMIILGSGGHTTEMLRIVENLDFTRYNPRIYVHAHSDTISVRKVQEVELNSDNMTIIPIFRSREVGQSYFTSIGTTLIAIQNAFLIIFTEKPDIILCNGPGTCVPLCLVAFLMKLIFLIDIKIIFIESFCRVKSLSLTGKILYYFANHIIIQWPQVCSSHEPHSHLTLRKMSRTTLLTCVDISWDILRQNCDDCVSNELKVHLQSLINVIESEVTARKKEKCWIEQILLQLEICLDRTWEELNTGHWKNISISHRYCYTLSSALKCIVLEMSLDNLDCEKKLEIMKEIVQQIDKGLLLGAPLPEKPDLLTKMAARVAEYFSNEQEPIPRLEFNEDDTLMELLSGFTWINRWKAPTMETFYREILTKKFPAVLEDCMNHWRALTLWKDPNYLIKIAGMRTVPIELGSRYTEDDWSQHLLTFSEFIRSHVAKNNSQVGYLAQHQLFEQIPELKDDFSIPDYCNFSEDSEDSLPDINAWFGPQGTISPLHYDPKNNLLCQVFGCKKIIMYPPNESPNLYPYDTRLLANTAQVDPLNPDLKSFPDFTKAKGLMCYLKPGEMLYIPPKWWHYVVSLSPSFSVSFWWT